MPHPIPRIPKYRHYLPKDLAVVRLDGRDHYLGRYGSEESREKYRRLIAEWLASSRAEAAAGPARPAAASASVNELVLAFWRHAEVHYRGPDGRPTGELANLRDALGPLVAAYGRTPAAEFGPLALRAVREAMVASGLARTTVNARVHRIRRAFRWAASAELVPAEVARALDTLAGLQRGRTAAPEPEPVGPVPVEHVEAVLPLLTRPVAAMVQLQLLTGCRAGEAMAIRGCDLGRDGPAWEYRPAAHKTAWRGRERVIPLGPRAQEVPRPFLRDDPEEPLFSPRDAVAEHHRRRGEARRTRPTPSEVARRSPGLGAGGRPGYDRRTYRQAIVRACRRAGVPAWSPLQLRHSAATALRSRYGLEAAQVVLGHARADLTQVYAERDLAKARAIAAEVG